MECDQSGDMADALCPSHGTKSGTVCTFERITCVSCVEYDKVIIRTQTNGMPSHCPYSTTIRPVPRVTAYTSVWMPATVANETNSYADVYLQEEVDDLLCDVASSDKSKVPEGSNYGEYTDDHETESEPDWGISITGVLMYSGLTPDGVDPYQPVIYGPNVTTRAERNASIVTVDSCLTDISSDGFLHYHAASVCIPDMEYYGGKGANEGEVLSKINQTY
jgi:hypothetical protein